MGVLSGPSHIAAIRAKTLLPLMFSDWANCHGLCPLDSYHGDDVEQVFVPGTAFHPDRAEL
jgi:hypothetical protein